MRKTLVLGASTNPSRYAYLAVQNLRKHGHEVVAVGRDDGQVGDVTIQKNFPQNEAIDTVTLYLNPDRQKEYYEQILNLKPKRIIFNPGTENEAFAAQAKRQGIHTEEACTLVLLNTQQYED